ncbi:uroporphyrinogen decarboxylase [Pseudalkalibacillus caeni]|uniref:Uroporphyrinogen decarboxylase n=1 Tax=Exobacillus caeni TaxID=2574798 RepID=A0A5R9FES4_9BACL|nr:uroporphyrinogen decarboxylase [Pseudalkalibacillus caeni]TLS38075.1 uroporphyrinogen decarboxylase [Pseudalkalibacillus caeni]
MSKPLFNDQFLKACRKEETEFTPVWYMRQAGRYQPEYRKIREKYTFEEMNLNPEVAAEVTRFAVEQLGVDAAILFADIMTPLPSIGVDVKIKSGVGPVINNPVRNVQDVNNLGDLNPEKDVPYLMETIGMLREQLNVPLIGFSGAPFTIASYMIEGGPSKNYYKTKAFMYSEPEAWFKLMDKLGDMVISYLKAQVNAGAQAIQIFDSWVGALNEADYRLFIAPVMDRIFTSLKDTNVPLIMFGVGASHLIEEWNKLPVDVLGLDWRLTIKKAREEKGIQKPLQGNLEPAILLAPWDVIQERTKEILDQGMEQPGFIFNLGHGVFPQVKVETLQRLTEFVHEYTAKR